MFDHVVSGFTTEKAGNNNDKARPRKTFDTIAPLRLFLTAIV
jgi:hypothetical protein